jgi:hypothetical protein
VYKRKKAIVFTKRLRLYFVFYTLTHIIMDETTIGEEETLHSTDGEATTETQEQQEEPKTTYTVEEVEAMKKEMQANSDR